jgi:hypothetical protein
LSAKLTEIFDKLEIALNNSDFIAIDAGIENLNVRSTDGILNEEIEKIKDAVLIMDYDGAIDVMRKICEGKN